MTLNAGQNNITVVATDKAGNTTTETFKLYFDPKAQTTYSYDLNGNLVQKSEKGVTWNYTWDAENRLIRVTTNDTNNTNNLVIEYGYFDNGNRAYKIVGAGLVPAQSNTYYVNDGVSVIAEYNGQGALQKEYLYSNNIDEVLQSVSFSGLSGESSLYYYHQDGLNSVVAVTDNTGVAVNTYNYEAFGKLKSETGTNVNNTLYTGRTLEREISDSFYYYRARYYDAKSGRFVGRDPIGFQSGDVNFYRYVKNNSIRFADPYGLKPLVPRYGNWCGPNWSGGSSGSAPPIDSLDNCCQQHDLCYGKNNLLKAPFDDPRRVKCDQALVKCSKRLNSDPKLWPSPAPCPKEAKKYRRKVLMVFPLEKLKPDVTTENSCVGLKWKI